MSFKVKIRNEKGVNLQGVFSEDLEYKLWGLLDIYVDDRSFFENFSHSFYGNGNSKEICFASSTVSQCGISVPIEPILISLLEVPSHLEKEGIALI